MVFCQSFVIYKNFVVFQYNETYLTHIMYSSKSMSFYVYGVVTKFVTKYIRIVLVLLLKRNSI